MKPARWTKPQIGFFGGLNAWLVYYYPGQWTALVVLFTTAYLAWLAPNQQPDPEVPEPMHLRRETSGND